MERRPLDLGDDKRTLENVLSGGGGGDAGDRDPYAHFRNQSDLAKQRREIMNMVRYCEHQEGGEGGCRKVLLQRLMGESAGKTSIRTSFSLLSLPSSRPLDVSSISDPPPVK